MSIDFSFSFDLKKAMRWSLLSLALVPLAVNNSTLFPFVFMKGVLFRLAVSIFWVLFAVYIIGAKSRGEKILSRINFGFIRNPIFVSVVLYMFFAFVSTLFAAVPSKAFFGTIERGGGYLVFLFLFLFLVGTLLVFRKKDWLSFFRLTLITGAIISIDTIVSSIQLGERSSGSFMGNPAFIATYLLFVLFSAFVLLGSDKNKFWRYASYGAVILSLTALVFAEVRGAFVGLFAGIVALSLYLLLRGGKGNIRLLGKEVRLRTIGMAALAAMVIFVSVFVATINNPSWQRAPGLDRIATISLEDATTQTRLISAGVSLESINPSEESVGRFLFGWGQSNFNVAYNKHYNPAFQRYETSWFDRAHNKLFDELVMGGIIGLISYLAIWFFIIQFIFRMRRGSHGEDELNPQGPETHTISIGAPIVFFASAYFVQNLFVFDQITSYVMWFVFLGFVIYLNESGKRRSEKNDKLGVSVMKYLSPTLAVVLSVAFVLYSVIPYYQMSRFISALKTESPITVFENIDSFTRPYNYAQPEIRFRLLSQTTQLLNTEATLYIVDRAIELEEEALAKGQKEPRYLQVLSFIYDSRARIYNEQELYPKSEELYREALILAPGRQELMFLLSQNLISQGRLDEAEQLVEEILALEPKALSAQFFYLATVAPKDWDNSKGTNETIEGLFVGDLPVLEGKSLVLDPQKFLFMRNSYNSYLQYFYVEKDAESFLNTMERALELELLFGTIQEFQRLEGSITNPVPDRINQIADGIEFFQARGWDGITPPK